MFDKAKLVFRGQNTYSHRCSWAPHEDFKQGVNRAAQVHVRGPCCSGKSPLLLTKLLFCPQHMLQGDVCASLISLARSLLLRKFPSAVTKIAVLFLTNAPANASMHYLPTRTPSTPTTTITLQYTLLHSRCKKQT